jgi:hypothetical protein
VATTTVTLSDDQLARLRERAAASRRTLDEVLAEAVDAYLAQHSDAVPADVENGARARKPFSPESQAEIDAALRRLRARVPADVTPDEIDAEIDAAWQEVRDERRARRRPHA